MDARIEGKTLDLQSKLEKIKLNIGALKEALEEIAKYEAKRAKKLERTSKASMFGA